MEGHLSDFPEPWEILDIPALPKKKKTYVLVLHCGTCFIMRYGFLDVKKNANANV